MSKKPSRYAAKPEFLASCTNLGLKVGNVTGKTEFAIAKATYNAAVGTAAVSKGIFAGHKASR